jgi:citrate lyase subunit beta/citryl-CoA lyase
VPTINRVFTPSDKEVAWARQVVQAAEEAERASGSGALQLASSEFVDVAVVRRAESLLRLADALRLRGAVEA